uniref:general transcription factor IIF subunit 2-like isoform X2 n=1 Tax=Monopterus albus TaxID=43700 RepID=UPI0009B38EAC|nr:general transcription factor IIF subunit 2-like isoform X2 [Monopterus albus]
MSDKAEVNLNGVKQSKGVWLVKVPKYLPQQWDRATGKREVGKITIAKKEGKTEVRFSLNEELTALGAAEEKDGSLQVPTVHPITMHTVGGQTLAVFSQSNSGQLHTLVTGGSIQSTAFPKQIKESTKPQRLSQQLEKAITTVYKPVANHDFNVEYEKKKKSEGKMVRAERQVVLDMLFSAFEKHQYYNIKDLVDITKQPVTYLKEIMREIGTYNSKGVHKSTWELKPEYRHYQSAEEEEERETA